MISKTLSPENQFRIKCPVFHAETRIASCFTLRDAWARGEKIEVRQGCQAALYAGKCPIPTILTRMIREGHDPYHSAEPKLGSLDPTILDKTAPVLVTDSAMKRYALSPKEEQALVQANEYARSGKHVPKKYERREERVIEDMPVKTKAIEDSAVVKAATSGDLGAGLSTEEK